MPPSLTEATEITTGLGTLSDTLEHALAVKPGQFRNVSDAVWDGLVRAYRSEAYASSFATAFANGAALLMADDGLRGRVPRLIEWKGPHRPPGDDVIPADLRIDHVYLVSCKYLSKILFNPGPARLFERLLVGQDRAALNWFATCAPVEYQAFYTAARDASRIAGLPTTVLDLTRAQQLQLKTALGARTLPDPVKPAWSALCRAVSVESADRWRAALSSKRLKLRLLWRLLRIDDVAYFVLGADKSSHLRLRVASAWDWMQSFELRRLVVEPGTAGQPEVAWRAVVRDRGSSHETEVLGHVEIRWSHGRFVGATEAKVYLDTPHTAVPGYYPLV